MEDSLTSDYFTILDNVLNRHADANKWVGSRFEKIRRLPNTKVGDVGQDYIEDICRLLHIPVVFPEDKFGNRSKQSPWDLEIEGIQFELKTATEDVSSCFQFNHIRYARPYHALMCLGIAPDATYFRIWSKADVATGRAGSLVSMEKSGSASYKLTKRRTDLLAIDQFGEELRRFLDSFSH